jgi:hypothetical protein
MSASPTPAARESLTTRSASPAARSFSTTAVKAGTLRVARIIPST